MEGDVTGPHLQALDSRFNSDVAAIRAAAESAREAVDGDASSLHAFAGSYGSTAGPLGEYTPEAFPPYVPSPLAGEGALIPDTPLIDGPLTNQSLAFDDAPLWQN